MARHALVVVNDTPQPPPATTTNHQPHNHPRYLRHRSISDRIEQSGMDGWADTLNARSREHGGMLFGIWKGHVPLWVGGCVHLQDIYGVCEIPQSGAKN